MLTCQTHKVELKTQADVDAHSGPDCLRYQSGQEAEMKITYGDVSPYNPAP